MIIACFYHFVVGFLIHGIFIGIEERDDVVTRFPEDVACFSVLVGTCGGQFKAVRTRLLVFVRLTDVQGQALA